MLIPAKLTLAVAPAALPLGIEPVQVPRAPPVKVWAAAVVVIPAGKVSLKAAPVIADALGLVRVKVMVEVAPAWIGVVPKILLMVAGPSTSSVVEAPVPASGVSVLVAPLVVLVWPVAGLMVLEVIVKHIVQV
jgi:hypothetical protein